jgi:transcriptional regulator with XRE-family HTH domain
MTGNARLRDELDRRELKPADLAKTLGMRRSIVLDVLRGHQDVRLRDVANIAKALGFKVDLVLEYTTLLDVIADPSPLRKARRAKVQWI